MNDIALKVEGLTKEYRLGTIGYGTMREDLQTWWAKIRGKEDPNSLISSIHSLESEKKHFLALDDVNFEINKGERVGIVGKNGAGKSTLLKVLSRITSPTKGNIYIDGRIGSLLEVGTGFHQELTGRENIFLNGSILGMKKWEINKKLDEIVDFAGIEKFIDTPVKRYSSGMFVRLGFAVAAHLEPEILIVDEVLAVGDAEFQKKAIGKMEDVSSEEGRTILFVSHNMASVRSLCQKGLLLCNGSVVDYGEINSVIDKYANIGIENINQNLYQFTQESKELNVDSVHLYSSTEEESNSFSCDDSISIKIALRISTPLPDLSCGISFMKRGETVLFCSSNDLGSNRLSNLSPGQYNMILSIPPRTLGHGHYVVNMQFTSKHVHNFIAERIGDIINFHLNDSRTVKGNEREGYLSTLLQWKLEK